MTAYLNNAEIWQESWDRQQEGFLPDREHRFDAMLTAVAAVAEGPAPKVLDLAGGTGSISLRALARFPGARVTVLDQDPVLLTIAAASLDGRATVVDADLGDPGWRGKLPHEGFDAVLTATALHWLPADRIGALYAEIRDVLRPGGIFVNADHMPDEGLTDFNVRLREHARATRNARYASGAVTSWADWWARAAADEQLGPKVVERQQIYPGGHAQEWNPSAGWHLDALRAAGFGESGVVWRGGTDAAVIGVR